MNVETLPSTCQWIPERSYMEHFCRAHCRAFALALSPLLHYQVSFTSIRLCHKRLCVFAFLLV